MPYVEYFCADNILVIVHRFIQSLFDILKNIDMFIKLNIIKLDIRVKTQL